jgi:signal transduction histidine kinase
MVTEDVIQILAVDDRPENLIALEAVLSPLGHRILKATSGAAALRLLLEHEVALILLDVAMPDVDGYEVAGLIRAREANRNTPIIFITAHSQSTSALFRGYSVGAVDYIFKPISADILLSKVTVFVDLYRRSRELRRQAEDLRRAHAELDMRVRERTEELAQANEQLKLEVLQRRRAERERSELLRREREARQEAERVNRTKDEFLATLSHELRTPLNAILGWTQLLEVTAPDRSAIERGIRTIKNNAIAQKQLIEDILDVSRIINGKMLLNLAAVDLKSLIEMALDTVRPAADAKRIELVTELSDVPSTTGDSDRLRQIVWNLLSNAIKFTPKDGRVTVALDALENDIRIVVSDTGRGIPAQFLPYIFDRFSQADSSFTRTHEGLGLGMAIVRHLVELHGGTVDAASPGEGQGATFTVTLPVRTFEAATRPHAAAPHEHPHEAVDWSRLPRLDRVVVLVVDNEADGRQIASAILRQQGATVLEAASGSDALECLSTRECHLIVSDIAMPHMDGHVFMRRLRGSDSRSRFVPAIALSAYVTQETIGASLAAGYQEHLGKPLDAADLIRTAAALVESASPSVHAPGAQPARP